MWEGIPVVLQEILMFILIPKAGEKIILNSQGNRKKEFKIFENINTTIGYHLF